MDTIIRDELSILPPDIKKVLTFFDDSGMILNSAKCEVFSINDSADMESVDLMCGVLKLLQVQPPPYVFRSSLSAQFSYLLNTVKLS